MAGKSEFFMLCLVVALVCISTVPEAEADKLIGSCVWGAVNYISNCAQYCKDRHYKNGHCGSAFNVNCWCET